MPGFFLLAAFSMATVKAQGIGDTILYDPGLELIVRAGNAVDYTAAAEYFEEIMDRVTDQWLLPYYAAYSYIKASHNVTGDKSKDVLMDKAQLLINKGLALRPNETELIILQAFLYQSRIQVNPQVRALTYSMKADAGLKQAAAADDGNPRAWSLMGYNVYHTPAAFGGGARKALPFFLKARDRFLSFNPELPFLPQWGEPENLEMVAVCEKSAD
jgi:hypothetical protein